MERVGTLIHKLLEQYEQQAQAGRLLMTAQMLLAELQQQQSAANGHASEKVTVVIPAAPLGTGDAYIPAAAVAAVITAPIPEVVTPQAPVPPAPQPEPEAEEEVRLPVQPLAEEPVVIMPPVTPVAPFEPVIAKTPLHEPVAQESASISDNCPEPEKLQPSKSWPFDPVAEVPTLAHQDGARSELNESMAANGESLNERLRVEKIELGNMLQGSPIRDLKKAIGINDRYLFINELFRGDETMYERSLKTINGFSILPEAEYWIQRELKVKLGWSESSESVHHFDQLVRRRFS